VPHGHTRSIILPWSVDRGSIRLRSKRNAKDPQAKIACGSFRR
jgi:hypothetical protein